MKYISYTSSGSTGLLQKVAAGVAAIAIAAGVVVFSSVILAVLVVAAAVGGIYLWWKTRHVRRMMRDMQANMARTQASFNEGGGYQQQGAFSSAERYAGEEAFDGVIIEGEAVHVEESSRPPRA